MRKCTYKEMVGAKPRAMEAKKDLVGSGMKRSGLASEDTLNSHGGMRKIVGKIHSHTTKFASRFPGILPRISRPLNGVCRYSININA